MRYAATFVRCGVALLLAAGMVSPVVVDALSSSSKLGPLARTRIARGTERSRVIVRHAPNASPEELSALFNQFGGTDRTPLDIIDSHVIEVPTVSLEGLANSPLIDRVSFDRAVSGTMERTSATIGAAAVRRDLGFDGSGVGVAIVDSGITPWHDDLAAPGGGQRVVRFVDIRNNRPSPYDDYGHGTHVAGIIGGDGFDSDGARTGVAPGAQLTVLKVLDAQGNGRISDVIAAFDYIYKKREQLNIRVVNLSVATGVYESYNTDPLTVAAKRLVDAGVVVVAASGNLGRTPTGLDAYGGVTAPGNAPWVLTVGASSHMGSVARADDQMAVFSSRGPTAGDHGAKPDLVAPGVGIESLSNPDSAFYTTFASYLLAGSKPTSYMPYLSLSGTSMAAPVVTGTVALMLQANPALTPNAVKAILQYTAQVDPDYDPLTQGAGFLDAASAVQLSRFFADSTVSLTLASSWSRRLIWGNQLVRGGMLRPYGSAWALGVTWGASSTPTGLPVDWGVVCADDTCDTTSGSLSRWSAACADTNCQTYTVSRNVVWGMRCGGGDCHERWTVAAAADESVVWGTNTDESVVWGTSDDGSVVWGTDDDGSVVWGTDDDGSVVWGTGDDASVVWGTSCSSSTCQPMIWNRP